ncbi:aminopeptidase [Luteolibacter flavescens]|uniref:Aminopeptidase n=1 Tax=Luteolibacter flavescens TaxID=1859460 RepID=A0ABT3FQ41_9BACT|nr:aminopeptidase [Luteolibacter flavescens]MCW1885701.1 aminopeptidase [Luteolibacter flavescens]
MLLSSCQTLQFYTQAVGGQMEILHKSRPNGPIIASPDTDPKLRKQLVAVEGIRRFASEHLSLPGHDSYGKYADLQREHVTWTLYAAPEFSLEPKRWWYPTLGKLDYRGFFKESDAEALATELRGEGFDVQVGGVDAYSTLGWFHDPVLNTFVHSADVDLAELIFHELTHRKYFRGGATVFNESFANAVAEEGVRRWLKHEGRTADLKKFEARLIRRAEFYDRIEWTRAELEKLYASDLPPEEMRRRKSAIFADLRDRFRELRRRWGGRGLEWWLTRDINNADLVSLHTYQKHVPTFHKLLADCGGDLDVFYKRVKKLEIPEEEDE